MKNKLYLIASSHLDTTWEWTLETTVEKFLPRTFSENMKLLDRYPHFVFGWEGAYRYELLEEYYPELFRELVKKVRAGRWVPCGSSYENGDVNQPSPESILRSILYGQDYFREKFGMVSNDIFLPDCFGFGWALPSIARHAGLVGFISQKLSFGSAYGYPFDIGRWFGSDGNWIFASIRPGVYSLHIEKLGELRKRGDILEKFAENERYGLNFTNRFFGVGDKGMGVAEETAAFVENEVTNASDTDMEIECVASPRFFDELCALDEETKARLPEWRTELPLSSHGVGGYTARAAGSRWNKANERLGDAAERACVVGARFGMEYPRRAFDSAWKRVLCHHFHDDLPGTSLMKCYMRNWNDYLISLNQFADGYGAALAMIAKGVDTSFAKGGAAVLFNPMISDGARYGVFSLEYRGDALHTVFGADGRELPTQIDRANGVTRLSALYEIPSLGACAIDLRECAPTRRAENGVSVTIHSLENEYLRAEIDKNGDVCSLVDKQTGREMLGAPIRHALFDYNGNADYPAWELTYDELMREPADYARATSIEVLCNGPVRGAIRITKRVRESTLVETVTLDARSRRLDFQCELDWRDECALCKVVFDSTANSDFATYDLGLGVIERKNNTPQVFECAAQNWADITDRGGEYGLSVLSDSKTGWDKPNDSTLRLTVVHTPKYTRLAGQAHNLLDLGLNRYGFAVFAHEGDWRNGTQRQADEYVHPVQYVAATRRRADSAVRNFASITDGALVRALKKELRGEGIVLRVNEPNGAALSGVRFSLDGGIASAFEANGVEERIGDAVIDGGELVFDLAPYEIKTFVLTPALRTEARRRPQRSVELPFDTRAVTKRGERGDLRYTIPADQFYRDGNRITCGAVTYRTAAKRDRFNAVACRGQKISLPNSSGMAVNILCGSMNGSVRAEFTLGDLTETVTVDDMTAPVGSWDMVGLCHTGKVGRKPIGFHATHAHVSDGTVAQCRDIVLQSICLTSIGGGRTLTLPNAPDLLVFAVTLAHHSECACKTSPMIETLDKRACDYTITLDAYRMLRTKNRHVVPDSEAEAYKRGFRPHKIGKNDVVTVEYNNPDGTVTQVKKVHVKHLLFDCALYDRGRDSLTD